MSAFRGHSLPSPRGCSAVSFGPGGVPQMAKKKSSWPAVLIIIGLLLGVGSAVNAATRPDDRLEFAVYSVVGFALLAWGMIKSQPSRRRGTSGPDRAEPGAAPDRGRR